MHERHYKVLGHSGLRACELARGTMTLSIVRGRGLDKAASRSVLDGFSDVGSNILATANFYVNGASKTLLGEFPQGRRDRVVLATKYSSTRGPIIELAAEPLEDPHAPSASHRIVVSPAVPTRRRFTHPYSPGSNRRNDHA